MQHVLEKEGFFVAPIADSTCEIDLIAIRNGETRGYRVKAHGKIYKQEVLKLREFSRILRIKIFIAKENSAREIVMWDVEAYS